MSKPDKIEIDYASEPLLADLDFPQLVKDYRKWHKKEKEAEAEAKNFKTKKEPYGEEILNAMKMVKADSVNMQHGDGVIRTTAVIGDPDATKLNESKLRENLLKVGKLDAALIDRIFTLSQDPAPRKPYVLITVQASKD